MLPSEVLGAFAADCRDLSPDETAALACLGIPLPALEFNYQRKLFKVRAAQVVFLDHSRFELAHWFRGDRPKAVAAIIVCRDELGEVTDLCAWNRRLDKVALWLGRVAMLGEENALAPRLGEPLQVFPSPAEWLADGRRGVVVVHAQRARSILHAGSPLAVRSVEFGQRLRGAFAAPLPRILVERLDEGAAG